MALQYGTTIRTPGATRRNVSSSDPQQQALLDAMNANGTQDQTNQPIDNQPTRTYSAPTSGGSNATTMPVPTNQSNQPSTGSSWGGSNSPSVGGGVTATGGIGSFSGQMAGFDSGKLNDPNKSDPKYDFGKIASNYDPRQGITPDMLGQLNALGHGSWAGSGDNLTYNGQNIDAIQGYKGGNGLWAWQPDDGTAQAGPTGQTTGGAMGTGDPLSQLTQLQSQANSGDTYSALVLKYLMQQLGLDQGMLANSQ